MCDIVQVVQARGSQPHRQNGGSPTKIGECARDRSVLPYVGGRGHAGHGRHVDRAGRVTAQLDQSSGAPGSMAGLPDELPRETSSSFLVTRPTGGATSRPIFCVSSSAPDPETGRACVRRSEVGSLALIRSRRAPVSCKEVRRSW